MLELQTIYQTTNLKVNARGLAAKEIWVEVTAVNPVDGKEYTRCAGWLSLTNTLHSGAKCPAYITETAGQLLHENKAAIFEAMERLSVEIGDEFSMNERRKYTNRDVVEVSSHPAFVQHIAYKDVPMNFKRTAKF